MNSLDVKVFITLFCEKRGTLSSPQIVTEYAGEVADRMAQKKLGDSGKEAITMALELRLVCYLFWCFESIGRL